MYKYNSFVFFFIVLLLFLFGGYESNKVSRDFYSGNYVFSFYNVKKRITCVWLSSKLNFYVHEMRAQNCVHVYAVHVYEI